jgi:excisionase family DNA binding protein
MEGRMQKLLSIREASEFLGLKVPTLYKYICSKKIPYVKLGSRVLFDPEKLMMWVEKNSV